MSLTTLTIQYSAAEHRGDPFVGTTKTPRRRLRHFGKRVQALLKGTERPTDWTYGTLAAAQTAVAATSGNTTLTINGVDIVVAFDTSQTVTATAVAAAVMASTDALVDGHVQASNLSATITLATCLAQGSISICGYTLRPVKKAALQDGDFEISGTDTQDAAALVAAVKACPGLQDLVWASNSAGVVTIRSRGPASTLPFNQLTKEGTSGVTLSAGLMSAGTTVLVSALHKGIVGNTITLAITGTGTSVGAARLAGGTSTTVTYP